MQTIVNALIAVGRLCGFGERAALSKGWRHLVESLQERLGKVELRLDDCERDRDELRERIVALEQTT